VVESTPRIFYAAAATGGLFKTENNGLNFTPVSLDLPVGSIGAVAVSQSKPDVVYLGTGRGQQLSQQLLGDGVYVSTDGARTWTHSGLTDSHHIGRIVVHPTDPNTAYVAALGHLYSDNEERASTRRPTAARTGRRRWTSRATAKPSASWTSRWIRRTRSCSTRRRTTKSAGPGRSRPAVRVAACTRRLTAASRGRS
jgi:hypothetical protein